jgi:hypothetical protein
MELSAPPPELLEGTVDPERAARIGRWLVLQEMGFFGDQTNLKIAEGRYKGSFIAAVRKRFSGLYGNTDGCAAADIEVAMEMLGVFDDIYDYELGDKSARAA